jgi:hypothetical protein
VNRVTEYAGTYWLGHVTETKLGEHGGGSITVADHRWPSFPATGCMVELRLVYRSPYWSLVEEDG